jgi:hypothetical protein
VHRIACSLCSASAALVALAFAASPAGAAAKVSAEGCMPATTQAFNTAAGGFDTNQYFLLAGGSFEAGTPAWTLTGGAALATGNNTAGGDPSPSTSSLSLPAGSSATSPAICVTPAAPTLRFYVRNTGAASAKLGVTVFYSLPSGKPASRQIAQITGTGTWQPTAAFDFFAYHLANASATGTTTVSFQFQPLDATGQWRVDDVYVDPFKRL